MKGKTRKVLLIAFLLLFVGSGAAVLHQTLQYWEADRVYTQAEALLDLPALPRELLNLETWPAVDAQQMPQNNETNGAETQGADTIEHKPRIDPYAKILNNMDFTALQEVNSDVKGWIMIPNTALSYPLMQGADNSYYLKRTYKQSRSASGAIFMDYRNHSNLSDFNSIVYGHRMKNDTMFGSLKKYKKLSYWKKNPYVYILNENGSHQYTIFASYEDEVSGNSYRTTFGGDLAAKQAFLDHAVGASWIQTGVQVGGKDQILTLSTCTGRGYETRLVVQAKLSTYTPSDTTKVKEESDALQDTVAEPKEEAVQTEQIQPQSSNMLPQETQNPQIETLPSDDEGEPAARPPAEQESGDP